MKNIYIKKNKHPFRFAERPNLEQQGARGCAGRPEAAQNHSLSERERAVAACCILSGLEDVVGAIIGGSSGHGDSRGGFKIAFAGGSWIRSCNALANFGAPERCTVKRMSFSSSSLPAGGAARRGASSIATFPN
jgi:hypothetical protein